MIDNTRHSGSWLIVKGAVQAWPLCALFAMAIAISGGSSVRGALLPTILAGLVISGVLANEG